LLFAASTALAADQFAKALVSHHLAGRRWALGSWIKIRYLANARPKGSLQPRVMLWLALATGLTLVVWQGHFFPHPAAHIALGAALGGAGSNLCDRLRRGAVIDFLDLGWWPVFNLADLSVTAGVLTALWFLR